MGLNATCRVGFIYPTRLNINICNAQTHLNLFYTTIALQDSINIL